MNIIATPITALDISGIFLVAYPVDYLDQPLPSIDHCRRIHLVYPTSFTLPSNLFESLCEAHPDTLFPKISYIVSPSPSFFKLCWYRLLQYIDSYIADNELIIILEWAEVGSLLFLFLYVFKSFQFSLCIFN